MQKIMSKKTHSLGFGLGQLDAAFFKLPSSSSPPPDLLDFRSPPVLSTQNSPPPAPLTLLDFHSPPVLPTQNLPPPVPPDLLDFYSPPIQPTQNSQPQAETDITPGPGLISSSSGRKENTKLDGPEADEESRTLSSSDSSSQEVSSTHDVSTQTEYHSALTSPKETSTSSTSDFSPQEQKVEVAATPLEEVEKENVHEGVTHSSERGLSAETNGTVDEGHPPSQMTAAHHLDSPQKSSDHSMPLTPPDEISLGIKLTSSINIMAEQEQQQQQQQQQSASIPMLPFGNTNSPTFRDFAHTDDAGLDIENGCYPKKEAGLKKAPARESCRLEDAFVVDWSHRVRPRALNSSSALHKKGNKNELAKGSAENPKNKDKPPSAKHNSGSSAIRLSARCAIIQDDSEMGLIRGTPPQKNLLLKEKGKKKESLAFKKPPVRESCRLENAFAVDWRHRVPPSGASQGRTEEQEEDFYYF